MEAAWQASDHHCPLSPPARGSTGRPPVSMPYYPSVGLSAGLGKLENSNFNSKLFLHAVLCHVPLGMESGAIVDSQINASTSRAHGLNHSAQQARLHFKAGGGKIGGWAVGVNDLNQWLQVDLQSKTMVTRIATQGRNAEFAQWVTKYKLQYGDDENSLQFYRQNGVHSDTVSLLLL